MRVIAGTCRGVKLSSFKGSAIRPTLDRVKESFFNQVSPIIEGARFLDLFAGTGSIGIEALSRGAAQVVFVENDRKAQDLIYKNLEICRFLNERPDGWRVMKSDALRAIEVLGERGDSFDLVYVDPPFEQKVYDACLLKLAHSTLLRESSLVVVEHFHKDAPRENYDKINLKRRRRLGDSCLSLYGLNSS
ncbi:MAG: 16S rRNA (guanine(966)-N(2))-methyltransferase RsmD [Nitrospinales bacterium]